MIYGKGGDIHFARLLKATTQFEVSAQNKTRKKTKKASHEKQLSTGSPEVPEPKAAFPCQEETREACFLVSCTSKLSLAGL